MARRINVNRQKQTCNEVRKYF